MTQFPFGRGNRLSQLDNEGELKSANSFQIAGARQNKDRLECKVEKWETIFAL